METAKTSPEKPNSETGNGALGGMRFNSTGRDDTTVEVMKQQRDPGAGKKIAVVIALILFGIIAIGALSYQRSGLRIGDALHGESGPSFGSQANHEGEPQ